MPSSPSSPHRHHHLLVIIPTPPLPSSPPRTITSTHAKHHRDNLLEGASGGGNRTEAESAYGCRVWLSKQPGRDVGFGSQTQGVRWCVGSPPKAATGGVGLAVGQPGIAGGRDVGFGAAGT
ncbi:hypothetical protein Tco_0784750 [Tanacetum coccineum]